MPPVSQTDKPVTVCWSANLNSTHSYTHLDAVSEMEDAIAMTITSATDDRIANSKYAGIIVEETTNIVIEKMLTLSHSVDTSTEWEA